MGFWEYFKAIAAICAVIFAAFYATRLVAKTGGGTFRKSAHVRLLGSLPLARDKSVALVAVGEHAYLLGVGPQRVERLDKLELSEFAGGEPEPVREDFSALLRGRLGDRLGSLVRRGPQDDGKKER